MIGAYTLLYFLLPGYLLKAKYWLFAMGISLLAILIIGIGHFMTAIVFPLLDELANAGRLGTDKNVAWDGINTGFLSSIKVLTAATGIKLVKYWMQKQRESEQLEKEKIETELRLLKAQVRPAFLFNALNSIYAYSLSGSPRAPGMLLKLSDLLSYMLYECNTRTVPLDKEIEIMKGYMEMEMMRQGENLELELNVRGDLQGKQIAPFLLLPFIENSFRQADKVLEQAWINMEIKIDENLFTMKLVHGLPDESIPGSEPHDDGLTNVKKRLSLLYPGGHDLKMIIEQEMSVVLLRIQLEEIREDDGVNYFENAEDSTTVYAQQ
jgi:LytS/YehU family sensor histidine kinase